MEPFSHRRGTWATLLGVISTVVSVSICEAQSPPIEVVLERLGAYVQEYEAKAFELAADEEYDQWVRRRSGYSGGTVEKRKLKSTYFLVRLPNGQAWYGFREVTSVDGRAVLPATQPMAQLLSERTIEAFEAAMAMTQASAKYNIGAVYRTVNVPLQTLEFFLPEHRNRSEFRAVGREKVDGQEAAILSFQERSRPTLVSDGFGGDLLSYGRVWVEPASGAVLRTEHGFGGAAAVYLKERLLRVDYQRDSRLQMLVPRQMEETYGLDVEVVHGRASYRNYRRFETGARLVIPNR
jgi:hypothetical protein